MAQPAPFDAPLPLSPKSSTFIREFREKQPVLLNSLTQDESEALRKYKAKEKEARAIYIKNWHRVNIEPLYEISGKHALTNKEDFEYDALQLLYRYTKKRQDRFTELCQERLKRIKSLSSFDQEAYSHHVLPVDQTPLSLQSTDNDIIDFLTYGLGNRLKNRDE